MPRLSQLLFLAALLAAVLCVVPASAQNERCFPEAAKCITPNFLPYWERNGSLAVFGFPITTAADEVNRDTNQRYLTQWFERNRFEFHPENQAPYDVLLGRLGDDRLRQLGRRWQDEPRESGPRPGCLWFAQTGHNVCDQANGLGFRSYWQTHALQDPRLDPYGKSLALFGLPLTEARVETNSSGDTVLTQWFERARFEYHPNNPDQFKVLLGLLGSEISMNLVANGDFEAPDIGPGFATAHAGENLGGWIVAQGSVDISGPSWQAASGKQSLDLTGEAAGTIYQEVATVPGQTYRLRFALAGNPDRRTVKSMTVAWGSTTIAALTFDATERTRSSMGWIYHEYDVVAESTRTRLTFHSQTTESPFGPMIDDVSLRQPTP